MRNRSPLSALRVLSLAFILGAVLLLVLQLVRFSREWANFPRGLTIGGIPVGGLDRAQASQRLLEIFTLPVELHYGEAAIWLDPATVGFSLDLDRMLAAADLERTRTPFWNAFWNYLWGRSFQAVDVPLSISSLSEERLRVYLSGEIAFRYDRAPIPALPIAGTVNFQPGSEGASLDMDRAVLLIQNALRSPLKRSVNLPLTRTTPSRPAFLNLAVLLQQTVEVSGFDGVAGLYLLDLQTGQEVSFAYSQGERLTLPPEVAFSASSTIKIPIMISVFRRVGENPEAKVSTNLSDMITKSINPASDWLMSNVLDPVIGPLVVTSDLQDLGFENTFLAGYFEPGAPLLRRITTPSNQRLDVDTQPDLYNQTTPGEIGTLLADLYQCAQEGGGALIAVFPEEITQAECRTMVEYLKSDRLGQLIEGGVPDGTVVAHKHGWITDAFGVMHNMSDAGIVYTPGGNYVLAIFLYQPTQLVYDNGEELISNLSRAAYNFYNLP